MILKDLLEKKDIEVLIENNVDVNKEYLLKEDFDELVKKIFRISFESLDQAERINDTIKDSIEYKNCLQSEKYNLYEIFDSYHKELLKKYKIEVKNKDINEQEYNEFLSLTNKMSSEDMEKIYDYLDDYFKEKEEYKQCDVFKTPLGNFKLVDKNNNVIDIEYKEDKNELLDVHFEGTDKNIYTKDFKSYIIRFDLDRLELNEDYFFKFSNKWKFDDSDERVFSLSYSQDDKIIAFSFQDLNENAEYYNQKRKWYDAYFNKQDVIIYVNDRDKKYGYCCLTWVWNVKDHYDDYDDACVVDTWKIFDM